MQCNLLNRRGYQSCTGESRSGGSEGDVYQCAFQLALRGGRALAVGPRHVRLSFPTGCLGCSPAAWNGWRKKPATPDQGAALICDRPGPAQLALVRPFDPDLRPPNGFRARKIRAES